MPYLPRPVQVADRAHIEVTVGSHLAFEGILDTAEMTGGTLTGLSAVGYGQTALGWGNYANAQTELATSGAILRDMVRQSSAVISLSPANLTDTGVLHAWSEFDTKTPHDAVEQLAREGNGASTWTWAVYEGRQLAFVPATPPSIPDYRLTVNASVTLRMGYTDVWDAARARYTDASGVTRYTSWVYAPGVDPTSVYLRRQTLTGGQLTETGAATFAATWIAQHATAQLDGQIQVPAGDGVPLWGGGLQPVYLVRAGQWVELDGYGMTQITRAQCNLTTLETTLQLGTPLARTFAGLLTRIHETAEAVRSGLSPVTGARAA